MGMSMPNRLSLLALVKQPGMLHGLLHEALDNMRAVWQRTLLSLLGIVIGTASVIALLSIGENTADEAVRQFKARGTDLIVVQGGQEIGEPRHGHSGKPLDRRDAVGIARDVPGIAVSSPISVYSVKAGRGTLLLDTSSIGAEAGLLQAAKLQLSSGRFVSDDDGYDTLVVVGSSIAQALASGGQSLRLGEKIRIDNYLYTVVGILKDTPRNPLLPFDVNQSLIVPFKANRRMMFYSGSVANILIRVGNANDPVAILNDVSAYLTSRGTSAQAQGALQLIEGMQNQNRLFTWMLSGLGAISLLVGGIGVMNVMLASIAERRKEIGLRMAIGADRASILVMIVFESVVLSLLGGIAGTILGLAASLVFSLLSGWSYSISYLSIPLGLGMSLSTGLFFGIYPALKASQMSPIDALR